MAKARIPTLSELRRAPLDLVSDEFLASVRQIGKKIPDDVSLMALFAPKPWQNNEVSPPPVRRWRAMMLALPFPQRASITRSMNLAKKNGRKTVGNVRKTTYEEWLAIERNVGPITAVILSQLFRK